MATFSKEIKSNRLLQSKRYTRASADSQEAFTRVIDLNASEIYSQESLLPTSSLPYSGSSQNGSFLTGTDGSTTIAEYYYRLRLTPDNVGNGSYFALATPLSNIDPQTVQSDQIVDWLSNKYLDPAIAATTNAESTPVGYTVQVTNGSTPGGAIAVSPNDYQFDYKSGVLQFLATPPSNNIYLSGYVYQGRTLASDAVSGYSGSFSGSFEGSADLNSLTVTGDSNLTGNTDRTGTLVQDGNLTLTGSFNQDGNISQIGDATLTGNTDRTGTLIQNGNLTLTGSLNQDGNINQIGDATLTGNTDRTGTLTQNGNLTLTGSFNQDGNINQIGDATLTGNTDRTGTLIQDGNLTLTGSFNHSGSYNLIGDINQTGSVFQSGSLDVNGPIFSQGTNVIDNAVALAIALG